MERDEVWRRIRAAASRSDWAEAKRLGVQLVENTSLPESEYTRAAGVIADAARGLGEARLAGTAKFVAGDPGAAIEILAEHPADAAVVYRAVGDKKSAGEAFLAGGMPAQAAVSFEEAGDFSTARLLWERLGGDPNLRRDLYVSALVAFNHGRCCARVADKDAARRSFVRAVGLLEEAADEFASRGERERAFDCYQVVLTLGREGNQFENVAEGFLNSVRILREDLLKYWALHYIEEFLKECSARSEFHAAATLLREAADYCQRQGLDYERWYRARSAEAWRAAAEHTAASGAPPELAENALLAAIDAWSAVGRFPQVCAAYRTLAGLGLADARRARYARIAARYEAASDESGTTEAFPEHLRRSITYPEVWHVDVVEWEQAGDPAALAMDLLADRRNPQSTRRLAFLCRVTAIEARPDDATELVRLAARLARLQVWAVLAPLEKLFASGAAPVRAAAVRAVRSLYFKRSFGIVKRALEDPADEVRKEALEAVRELRFAHAFDPLVRIFRKSNDRAVRLTALRSIGAINALEAAEHVLDVLTSEEPTLREEAAAILVDMQVGELDALLRRAQTTSPPNPTLAKVLRARGHSPGV